MAMRRTKQWRAVAGIALGLSVGGCGGDEAPGTGMMTGPVGTSVNPPGVLPGGAGMMAIAGTGAPVTTPPTNTMNTGGVGGAGGAVGPMAGNAAMPNAGGAAMPMAGMAAMPMAGTGAMPGTPPDLSMCMPAPADATPAAVMALQIINSARVAAGAGCVRMVAEINKAAENHCKYYIDPANDGMCTSNPHGEVMGCAQFTGTGPGQRMAAAGYMARGGGEVMAFNNDPKRAIDQWINSVWHRIPLLDPWTMDLGYGATAGCDVIDFGTGSMAPADTILLYPYDGQTNVPVSFNGQYEGPMPPAPPTGWPSASPITVYGRMLNITEHVLTKDGDPTPIEHTWITGSDPMWGNYLSRSVFMYAHAPSAPNTKYRVRVKGTSQAGALEKEWTFTTGAAPTRPGRP
jgi:hypothetical protein